VGIFATRGPKSNAGRRPLVPHRARLSRRPYPDSACVAGGAGQVVQRVVLADIGPPSAIAQNEFWGRRYGNSGTQHRGFG
jgi:hypothetical protein